MKLIKTNYHEKYAFLVDFSYPVCWMSPDNG